MSQPSLFSSRAARIAALLVLFAAAFGIRLYDLTDPPLDFHPTRQLLSAIKARALYMETWPDEFTMEQVEVGRRQAKLKAQIEPVVLEHLVAFTYRFTGEQVWVARVYSSLFWLVGGAFLFLLVRDLLSFDAALIATAYYLLYPYAILASRSFQPDPLMVTLILAFWWTFWRWLRFPSWTNTILAGLLGGFAIYIKFSAAFFVIGAALGLGLSQYTWRELLRNGQVWGMAILGALPGTLYLINGVFIEGSLGDQFRGRFIPALLVNPFNYLQWMVKVDLAAGGLFIMLGLLGFFLTRNKRLRSFMVGLWSAYLLYSLFFNYHVATHDYYHLPFLPIVAVSLGPLGEWFFTRLAESTVAGIQRNAVYLILLAGMFMVLWNVRNQMKAADYRPEAAMWTELGKLLEDKTAIALMQDYGSRLEYWGWMTVPTWPHTGDPLYARIRGNQALFEEMFVDYSSRKDYFLVTDLDELEHQGQLRERLNGYPIYMQGNGYMIYQLRAPK
jgi:hypothetical protein